MEEQQQDEFDIQAVGAPLANWQIDEYPREQRSTRWYVVMGLAAAACIIYALATANFLFAVIILMIGVITLVTTFQEPARMDVFITTTGIVIGNSFYEFRSINDFSIVYDPPHVKLLYVTFVQAWRPMLAIPLEDVDPNEVRDQLLPYCLENLNRSSERLTDRLRRVYKL